MKQRLKLLYGRCGAEIEKGKKKQKKTKKNKKLKNINLWSKAWHNVQALKNNNYYLLPFDFVLLYQFLLETGCFRFCLNNLNFDKSKTPTKINSFPLTPLVFCFFLFYLLIFRVRDSQSRTNFIQTCRREKWMRERHAMCAPIGKTSVDSIYTNKVKKQEEEGGAETSVRTAARRTPYKQSGRWAQMTKRNLQSVKASGLLSMRLNNTIQGFQIVPPWLVLAPQAHSERQCLWL